MMSYENGYTFHGGAIKDDGTSIMFRVEKNLLAPNLPIQRFISPDPATPDNWGTFAEITEPEWSAIESGYSQSGGSGGGPTTGTTTIDFGAFPGATDAIAVVTGQTGILSGSVPSASIRVTGTSDHSADEHRIESIELRAGAIVAGTGFSIYARNTGPGRLYGSFAVNWTWS